jgi:hypothetical protein
VKIEKTACEGIECTVERSLPFAGPLIALGAILIVALSTATTMLVG